jgi:hypothetical protein
MKTKGYLFLPGFMIFLGIIGIACNISARPTPQPTQPKQQQQPTPPPTQPASNTNSNSAFVPFKDKNNLYQILVPGNWQHTSNTGPNVYIDQFKAPDGNALIENISYNDGKPFTGAQNGQFALYLLHQFYSSTGKEGDIHINTDKILPSGREQLTWTSKGRNFSGQSYFEVRNKLNFLMFTVEWSNNSNDTYLGTLNKIAASYSIP